MTDRDLRREAAAAADFLDSYTDDSELFKQSPMLVEIMRRYAAALRAALAAQPQPLKCPRCDGRGRLVHPNLPHGQASWSSIGTEDYKCAMCHGTGLVVYPAVAGPATPTHRDEAGNEWITPAEDVARRRRGGGRPGDIHRRRR